MSWTRPASKCLGVDCIYEGGRSLYIQPDECVDCGAYEPVCPVEAIFTKMMSRTNDGNRTFSANADFFDDPVRRAVPARSARPTTILSSPHRADRGVVAFFFGACRNGNQWVTHHAVRSVRTLPDFPWDTIAGAKATAAHPDGIVDLSVGTPVDAVDPLIRRALDDGRRSGYPRRSVPPTFRGRHRSADQALRDVGTGYRPDPAPVIGTKEAIAGLTIDPGSVPVRRW